MAIQFTAKILPDHQVDKLEVVESTVLALPAEDELVIAINDDVPTYRVTEILNGWKFLLNGVRDRGLLDSQFKDTVVVTSSRIDSLNESDRRTHLDLTFVLADDVVLMVGLGMNAVLGNQTTTMIEASFNRMIAFANESFKAPIPVVTP